MKTKDKPTVTIQRFDRDFFKLDTTQFLIELERLASDYPLFYPVFTEGVLGITQNYQDLATYVDLLYEFRTHRSMLGLRDSVGQYFPDMDSYADDFSDAFAEYKRHYPDRELPEVVAFISEFGNKAILYEGGIGISLDMFLGSQYPYYGGMQLPNFIIDFLVPGQILPNAMRVWAEDHVRLPEQDETMLDRIVYEGRKLYFAEKMLPDLTDDRIIEYTPDELKWVRENEFNIWSHLLEADVLYSTKYLEYRRYVDDAPTTYGLPPEAPGRTGIWLGWQIVRAYARKHSGADLEEVLMELTAREILDGSAYKPRR